MKELFFTATAENDLNQIYDYISRDSIVYAKRFILLLRNQIFLISEQEFIGKKVEEANDNTIREFVIKNYRVFYKTDYLRVIILRIIHSRRNFSPEDL